MILLESARSKARIGILLSLAAGSAALAAGCDRNRQVVSVRVSIPDPASIETPASGVGVVALPYDRDSLLASLESKAGTPRPHTAALDSLFSRFRGPFTTYTAITSTVNALRDSLGSLQTRLDALTPGSSDRTALVARHKRMSDSLARLASRSRRAGAELARARTEFVGRSESLRAAVRQWEDSTYRGWDGLVESLARARRREPVTDTTDATGWARFDLPPGQWWIYARAWDTADPNSQWYWNVPVDRDTILLSSRSGERRPRY